MKMQSGKPPANEIHWVFVTAWLFALIFYFLQYGLRSAPSVMVSDLTTAYGLTALGISSLIGVYYYTYSSFALVAGACLDRYGRHPFPTPLPPSRIRPNKHVLRPFAGPMSHIDSPSVGG
jgi:hypothetical protein